MAFQSHKDEEECALFAGPDETGGDAMAALAPVPPSSQSPELALTMATPGSAPPAKRAKMVLGSCGAHTWPWRVFKRQWFTLRSVALLDLRSQSHRLLIRKNMVSKPPSDSQTTLRFDCDPSRLNMVWPDRRVRKHTLLTGAVSLAS